MAKTYSYCDGNTKVDVTITDTIGAQTFNDQYTSGSGQLITETYKKMTLSASPVPADDIRVYIGYETGVVWGDFYTPPSTWYTTSKMYIYPAGQSSMVIDLLITQAICYGPSSGEEGY